MKYIHSLIKVHGNCLRQEKQLNLLLCLHDDYAHVALLTGRKKVRKVLVLLQSNFLWVATYLLDVLLVRDEQHLVDVCVIKLVVSDPMDVHQVYGHRLSEVGSVYVLG